MKVSVSVVLLIDGLKIVISISVSSRFGSVSMISIMCIMMLSIRLLK